MNSIHIDELCSKGPLAPMIVNFQNGYATDHFQTINAHVFEDNETSEKTVAIEVDGQVYAGKEAIGDLGKSFIIVRNKKTGRTRIIEAANLDMKPYLTQHLDTSPLLETSNLELSRKFGSKKQKQQMEQREKLKVNVETVTEQMQGVVDTITENKLDLTVYNKNDSDDFYVPPIDRAADRAEDVYDIDKILTEEEYEKIYSELENKDYMAGLTPLINSLVSNKKLSAKLTVLAVYASSLLKLNTIAVKEITKKSFDACPLSSTLNQIVLSNFTTVLNGKRTRSIQLKDKSLCHAIVFMLLINNLKLDLDSLSKEIKLTQNTTSLKVRVTGASIVTNGSKKIVHLKLPLNTKSGFRRKSAKF